MSGVHVLPFQKNPLDLCAFPGLAIWLRGRDGEHPIQGQGRRECRGVAKQAKGEEGVAGTRESDSATEPSFALRFMGGRAASPPRMVLETSEEV